MREGLRSGKLRIRPERDEILSEKKVKLENPGDTTYDVNLDGREAQVLWVGDKEAVIPPEQGGKEVGSGRDEVLEVNVNRPDSREQGESDLSEKKVKLENPKDITYDVNLDGSEAQVLLVCDKEAVVPSEQGGEDVGSGRDEVLEVNFDHPDSREQGESENGESECKNQSMRDCCDPKATSGTTAKRVEADDLASAEPFSRRVLRSMTIFGGVSEKREREEDEIISTEVKQKRGRTPKIEKAEVDENENDEIISAKSKKKRGRPPKTKQAEINEREKGEITSTEVKKKRGRPRKFEEAKTAESEKEEIRSIEVKKKRGRPPKVEKAKVDENNEEVKEKRGNSPKMKKPEVGENKKDKQLNNNQVPLKLRRKRGHPCNPETFMIAEENGSISSENRSKKCDGTPKEEESTGIPAKKPLLVGNVNGSRRNHMFLRVKTSWKKMVGKALNRGKGAKKGKQMRHVINRTEDDVVLENGEGNEESNTQAGGRRKEKQMVRDKIMKLILGAGWTVQYKSREGRSYQDSIYVSPNGRAYWSITLAYKVLKRHYDEGNGESSAYTRGFVFNPISNEELSILARIAKRKRKDAGRKDGEVDSVMKKKKLKGKRNSFGGPVFAKVRGESSLDRDSLLSSGDRRILPTENNKRRGLLVRKAMENESGEENYILYKGKRTVLAWMIDMGVVPNNGVVFYIRRKTSQAGLNGLLTKDGIHCSCCDEVVTITEFEAHAGHEGRNMALQNILLDDKMSLLQCELTTWNKQEELVKKGFCYIETKGDDPNDDTCGICGDGGNLVCCENCPSTFHLDCLGIKKSPSGDWHCPHCSCKYCGVVAVGTCERSYDGDTAISALNKCLLCEEKFHRLCVLAEDAIEDAWASRSFCGKKCLKLHKDIKGLLGVEHKLEEGYSCTLVQRSDIDFGITTFDELSQKVHSNSKVAVALSIMDECFLPVDDRRSGINLIHNILYNCGSNFNRLNFSGFYTAILEKGDGMISVASIRIHGNQFAEMPFIGTRYAYRRQGMCRRLLTALESILCTLKVEKLVIPAIDELKETWTSVFGFEPVRGKLRKRMRNMNVLAFPGVNMLQKQLSVPPALVETAISIEGSFSTQDKNMNKDGSDITNDSIQFSDSENGENLITQSDEPSYAEEKCCDIMDPAPEDRESPQDLSACLNLETPSADVGLEEVSSHDVTIIPCAHPCRSDVADEESLIISISNGGSTNEACDKGTKSHLSEEFSANVLDGKEGLALGNESLSPDETFHDAEEEILAVDESLPDQEGEELPSSECETEHLLHQAPMQDITVSNGQVLVADSHRDPSAEEGTKTRLSMEFLEIEREPKEGLAPVNVSPSPNELFYDAKEETLTAPCSPTDSCVPCNEAPPAAPSMVSPSQVVPVDSTMNPGEVVDITKLNFCER